ncbi:hypothetical protein EDD18DRAFT_1201256, partial [Armillaria luteobubalina]
SADFETRKPPIESLPPEILPWLLARVCRRWRDITWDCPALWASIMVYWPQHGKTDAEKKTAPGRASADWTDRSLHNDFAPALVPMGGCSHTHSPPSTWTQFAQPHLPRLCLPSLRSLALGRQPFVDELSTILDMFKDMPTLKSFQFHIYRVPSSDFDPNLTHLVMSLGPTRECSVDASIKVLGLCFSLETLREETMLNDDPGTTLVTLERLRSLSVRSPQLLYCLVCPALEDLTVLPRYDISFSIPTCLALDDTSMTLPNLNIIEMEIPELFTGEALSEEVDELLVRIIDMRWNVPQESPVSRLRQVRIRCSKFGIGGAIGVENQGDYAARNYRTMSHVDRLKSFKKEGLDISIVFEQGSSSCRHPCIS